MEALGFAAMVGMGVVLGTLGAGGSILVLPILVYLFGVAPSVASGYSLLTVGATALVGGIIYARKGQSDLHMAVVFGTPSIAAVYLTRRFFFPAVPDPVLTVGGFALGKDQAVMLLFATFMFLAAGAMMRNGGSRGHDGRPVEGAEGESGVRHPSTVQLPLIFVLGFAVGVFTGMVGAGGGFMILPVLVLLGGLPMKVAVGTDLLIIAAKSLLGFIGEVQAVPDMEYGFIVPITVLPLVGMAIGTRLNKRAPARLLRKAFGWLILLMGSYIVLRELL